MAKGRRPVIASEASAAVVGVASEASAAERRRWRAKRDLFLLFGGHFFRSQKIVKHYLSRHSEVNFLVIY